MIDGASGYLQIPISGEESEVALYASQCNISISAEEAILHFGQILPGRPQAVPIARVCVSLPHAKRIMLALQQSLLNHEEMFGPIAEDVLTRLTAVGREKLGLISEEGAEPDSTVAGR
jgi:hypothetical protein